MGQKDTIIDLLQQQGVMTQGALAEAMYGDKNHMPNIYASLMALVKAGIVHSTEEKPAYYSLNRTVTIKPKETKGKSKKHTVMFPVM